MIGDAFWTAIENLHEMDGTSLLWVAAVTCGTLAAFSPQPEVDMGKYDWEEGDQFFRHKKPRAKLTKGSQNARTCWLALSGFFLFLALSNTLPS